MTHKYILFSLVFVVLFFGLSASALACGSNSDCPAGQTCVAQADLTKICVAAASASPSSSSASSASSSPSFGVTLPNPLCWSSGGVGPPAPGTTSVEPCINTVQDLLAAITAFVLDIIGALAVVMFIYAGFLFLTYPVNPGNLEKGKKALLYAIIGVAIALAGNGLIIVIKAVLNVPAA